MAQSQLNLTGINSNNSKTESYLRGASTLASPDYFAFMELPKEIRGLIYQHIPQAQIGNSKLVCKQFQAEIDELYTFSGFIHDQKPGWEKVFGLRLKSCVIGRFETDQPKLVFKFPNLLKKLVFRPDSIVSAVNVHCLLRQCSKNLEDLVLPNFRIFEDRGEISNTLAIANFSSLKSLNIEIQWISMDAHRRRHQLEALHQLFCNSTVNSLQSCFLNLCIYDASLLSKYTCLTLALLAQSWNTMDSLAIGLFPSVPNTEKELLAEDLQLVDFKSLAKLSQLTKFCCLVIPQPTYLPSDSPMIPLWSALLQQQCKLVRCTIEFPLPWATFKTIISKNSWTLDCLTCSCLVAQDHRRDEEFAQFDMTLFMHCSKLTYLYLELMDCSDKIQVINLSSLPASLTILALKKFRVLLADLYEFISSPTHNLNFVSENSLSISSPFDNYDELMRNYKSDKLNLNLNSVAF